MIFKTSKQLVIKESQNLYKWASVFSRLQRNYFAEPVKIRREKQIEDFIYLNGFSKVKFVTDTDVFAAIHPSIRRVNDDADAEIVVITDQKFSRYPCVAMIEQIKAQLDKCPKLFLCLNRHYVNIDNSYVDPTLDANFTIAITQFLKKNLPGIRITDMSIDYLDIGESFTWVIPDRMYYIEVN